VRYSAETPGFELPELGTKQDPSSAAVAVVAAFRSFKDLKILQDSPSHRIFRRIHRALNIGKK
jgi:hypothetical protein